eukprot:s4226_g1.t1
MEDIAHCTRRPFVAACSFLRTEAVPPVPMKSSRESETRPPSMADDRSKTDRYMPSRGLFAQTLRADRHFLQEEVRGPAEVRAARTVERPSSSNAEKPKDIEALPKEAKGGFLFFAVVGGAQEPGFDKSGAFTFWPNMFLFGSGSQGQPASEDVHQQLVDKDEEIDELKAKILALRDALEKEPHFEHFEMAMDEKNKVLEEQFARVEELQKENNALKERLEHSTPESAPSKGPECSQTEASVVQSAEATAAFSKVEALEGQLTLAIQEIEELRASSNVEDAQRVRTENLELRSRLAHAIYCSTEAQKAVAAQSGRPTESVEELRSPGS